MPKRWRELARALEITASPDASPFHNLETIDSFLSARKSDELFGGEGPEDREGTPRGWIAGKRVVLDLSRASKKKVRSWLR